MIKDYNSYEDDNVDADEILVDTIDRIDQHLTQLIVGVYVCAGLLGILAFVFIVRFMLGR